MSVKTIKDTNRMMTSYLEGVKVNQNEVNWEKTWTIMNEKSLEEKRQNQYGFTVMVVTDRDRCDL